MAQGSFRCVKILSVTKPAPGEEDMIQSTGARQT